MPRLCSLTPGYDKAPNPLTPQTLNPKPQTLKPQTPKPQTPNPKTLDSTGFGFRSAWAEFKDLGAFFCRLHELVENSQPATLH